MRDPRYILQSPFPNLSLGVSFLHSLSNGYARQITLDSFNNQLPSSWLLSILTLWNTCRS